MKYLLEPTEPERSAPVHRHVFREVLNQRWELRFFDHPGRDPRSRRPATWVQLGVDGRVVAGPGQVCDGPDDARGRHQIQQVPRVHRNIYSI
eukprot:8913673-Pyramimonas_sp.AAC.1